MRADPGLRVFQHLEVEGVSLALEGKGDSEFVDKVPDNDERLNRNIHVYGAVQLLQLSQQLLPIGIHWGF